MGVRVQDRDKTRECRQKGHCRLCRLDGKVSAMKPMQRERSKGVWVCETRTGVVVGCAFFLYMEGGGTRKPRGALYCYIWKEAEPKRHRPVNIMQPSGDKPGA